MFIVLSQNEYLFLYVFFPPSDILPPHTKKISASIYATYHLTVTEIWQFQFQLIPNSVRVKFY